MRWEMAYFCIFNASSSPWSWSWTSCDGSGHSLVSWSLVMVLVLEITSCLIGLDDSPAWIVDWLVSCDMLIMDMHGVRMDVLVPRHRHYYFLISFSSALILPNRVASFPHSMDLSWVTMESNVPKWDGLKIGLRQRQSCTLSSASRIDHWKRS